MKKFLFVANRFDSGPAGGTANCHAHYEALCDVTDWQGDIVSILSRGQKEIPAPNKISVRSERNTFDNFVNALTGKTSNYGTTYSTKAENEIINIVKNGAYDFIWFDECTCGSTIKKIKRVRPNIPIYAFFHVAVSTSLMPVIRKKFFTAKGLVDILKHINYTKHQKLTAEYADVNVILNERDMMTFTGLYGSRSHLILPACFIDNAKLNPVERKPDEFNIFFIGIGMKQNFDSIKWFVSNVMPKLDNKAKFIIAGSVGDMCKDEPEFKDNPKITITGRVESLDPYYNMADLVVTPILYGEGMMTKVGEAMMYGKNILATSHALNGYPEIESQCRCDTSEEFITRINSMIENGTERFNPEMRRIFEERYSVEAMTRTLREDFQKRGIL